jgi:hypothetical protein
MPFKSQAQRRKFYAMASKGEISKATVKHWEEATPKGKKLPEHVKKAIAKIANWPMSPDDIARREHHKRIAAELGIPFDLYDHVRLNAALADMTYKSRTKTAEPPPPKGVSAEEWDRILQKGAVKRVTKQIKLSMAAPMPPDQYINQVIGQIKFPKREHLSIRERLAAGLPALTTRVSKERGRYTLGQILNTPWGDRVQITRIGKGRGYTKHPFLQHLTTGQRNAIRRRKYDLVEFQKIGGVRIGPSSIAGQGLIANTPYERGDVIGPAIDKVPIGGDLDDQHLQTALGRYVNHATDPTAELAPLSEKQWGLRALRDIGVGEEITADYRSLPGVIPGLSVPIPGEELLENIKKAAYHLNVRRVLYGVNSRRGS